MPTKHEVSTCVLSGECPVFVGVLFFYFCSNTAMFSHTLDERRQGVLSRPPSILRTCELQRCGPLFYWPNTCPVPLGSVRPGQ